MAQALIENIWAAAALAHRWVGGQGTKGACERVHVGKQRRPALMPVPRSAGAGVEDGSGRFALRVPRGGLHRPWNPLRDRLVPKWKAQPPPTAP